MEMKGDFGVESGIDRVWAIVSDAREFTKCLPDVKSSEIDGDKFRLTFGVDIREYTKGFLGASYMSNMNVKFKAEIKEKEPQKHVYIAGDASAFGMKFSIGLSIDLSAGTGNVKVTWVAYMDVGGFAKIFGADVIDKAAKTIVEQIVANLKEQLKK